jgi:hypothetical protein
MEDIREHSIRSPGGSHSLAGLSMTNKQMGDKAMSVYRIHPTVGVARVGNSDNYILAPETMAGAPASGDMKVTGGLPIRPGTEAETIRSSDLRDATGALKRQAARFRVFAYPEVATETWPRGDGTEVRIGDKIGDRIVKDIIWTVHVANKKANWFVLAETENQPQGIASYANGNLPDIRNPDLAHSAGPQPAQKLATLAQPDRITKLVIDPGPRVIHGVFRRSQRRGREYPSVPDEFSVKCARAAGLPIRPDRHPRRAPDGRIWPSVGAWRPRPSRRMEDRRRVTAGARRQQRPMVRRYVRRAGQRHPDL